MIILKSLVVAFISVPGECGAECASNSNYCLFWIETILYKGHQWSLYKAVNIVHFDFESSFLKVGVLISSWTLPLAKYFLKPLCGIPCRFWNITIQELAPFLSTFWFWVAFQIKTLWTFNSSWTWGTFPF